jgi:hypothetical protein
MRRPANSPCIKREGKEAPHYLSVNRSVSRKALVQVDPIKTRQAYFHC